MLADSIILLLLATALEENIVWLQISVDILSEVHVANTITDMEKQNESFCLKFRVYIRCHALCVLIDIFY